MKETFSGFKKFILRGNALDLAIGVVIGASFGGFVNSLVKDILTPFIGAIIKVPDFSELTFTINQSEFMYGNFINSLISLIIIASVIYFLVILPINTFFSKKESEVAKTKKCRECLSEIPLEAKRCFECTQLVE